MEGKLVLNLDKVRQGIAVNEGELLHKTQMKLLLAKIKQIMSAVSDFRRQFEGGQRPSAISHRRHHDAILLSGARGTGKTTFLLSALHKLQAEQVDGKYAFCVFEPVDPTLFGCNEHILLTLLSMIAEKVRRGRDYSETSGYGHTGSSADWENWERQLKELAKGLRTVGEQREDIGSEPSARKDVWDDAEYLLEQGMDSARSSYELEYKLHGFINASLRLLNKDAFVLGLDDVDTRPGIGWHVLEVLRRYLTTPQLIVIVSGNMELFQKLVERQQLKNFGLDFSSSKDVLQNFAPQVTELTNQYLLKVLRTPMRIELLPFAEALERAVLAERNVSGKLNSDIDAHCIIRLDGKEVSLASALDNFYIALGCGADPNLKAVFRKALLTNSARTVLQVVEQLIELQNTSQTGDGAEQSRRVADILRIAFFDYLMASGVAQPQEYFERLREGTGIEEITRLLLTDRLPGDVSLRPVHGDLGWITACWRLQVDWQRLRLTIPEFSSSIFSRYALPSRHWMGRIPTSLQSSEKRLSRRLPSAAPPLSMGMPAARAGAHRASLPYTALPSRRMHQVASERSMGMTSLTCSRHVRQVSCSQVKGSCFPLSKRYAAMTNCPRKAARLSCGIMSLRRLTVCRKTSSLGIELSFLTDFMKSLSKEEIIHSSPYGDCWVSWAKCWPVPLRKIFSMYFFEILASCRLHITATQVLILQEQR